MADPAFCQQKKKDDERCGHPASYVIHWPGSAPLFSCAEHTQMARRVAQALGFELVVQDAEGLVAAIDQYVAALDAARRLGGKTGGEPGKE